MKPVFKCDYCSKIGTEKEIKVHEPACVENYDRKSCFTCAFKQFKIKDGQWYYECKGGEEIPTGKIIEFCDSYVRKESTGNYFADMLNDMFKY